MRILLSGLSGTGSTTAAKRIAADFHLDYVYGGQIFRNLARERGISLEDLAESLELDREHHARSAENLLRRGASDNRRYKMLYGIEENDFTPFDLVLDTTNLSVNAVVDAIESFIRARTGEAVMVNSSGVEGSHSPV